MSQKCNYKLHKNYAVAIKENKHEMAKLQTSRHTMISEWKFHIYLTSCTWVISFKTPTILGKAYGSPLFLRKVCSCFKTGDID